MMLGPQPWRDGTIRASDGLKLYFRDYGDPASRATPILCLSGLTRNARDFESFALRYATRRRIICPDYRGRGRSEYDPNDSNYNPLVYAQDVMGLLAALGLPKAIFVGTSLGGLVSMAVAAIMPVAVAGVVLNDVGPVIDPEGRKRIAGYVGKDQHFPDYETAAQAIRALFARAYPDKDEAFWLNHARSTFVEDATRGGLRLNYDLALANPIRRDLDKPLPDLWPYFRALAMPVMAVRGELSDVLSEEVFHQMSQEKPDLIRVRIPNRGHVPLLDETPFVASFEEFLSRIA